MEKPMPRSANMFDTGDEEASNTPATRKSNNNAASAQHEGTMDWSPTESTSQSQQQPATDAQEEQPQHTAMTTTTRRNASGTVSSVFSGNKIRYLKKDDGQPLWRKDIQYLFLRYVFENDQKVFTRASDGKNLQTFADIYIDAMANSSKCSQVLKDKLLSDRTAAMNMAMICLLVNVGRMNTTLNFFPEMRARVRTYHSIPCLQAHQGSQAYKQLQDGPRLKSILKGATEDTQQPGTIEEILKTAKPRTNPVNLIFVLSQYAPKISENHFPLPRDFFDLFTRPTLSSSSRATAFLWLVWWYLESDFSVEDSQRNPFGPGIAGEDGGPTTRVPAMEVISVEEGNLENQDTQEELDYGEAKRIERESIVANDMPPAAVAPKRGQKAAITEQQYNYRFRHSPFGSSGSESARASQSPPPPTVASRQSFPHEKHRKYAGSTTRTPSPTQATAAHSARIEALLNGGYASDNGINMGSSATKTRTRGGMRSSSQRKSRYSLESSERRSVKSKRLKNQSDASRADGDYPGENLRSRSSLHNQNLRSARSPERRGTSGDRARRDRAGSPYDDYNESPVLGGSSGRSKLPNSAEASKRDKIELLLHERVHEARKAKSAEVRKRGIVVDSWIKTCALPEGYDSEEDLSKGFGGIEDLFPDENLRDGDGDVGVSTKRFAKMLRKLTRSLDGASVPKVSKGQYEEMKILAAINSGRNLRNATTNAQQDGMPAGASTSRTAQEEQGSRSAKLPAVNNDDEPDIPSARRKRVIKPIRGGAARAAKEGKRSRPTTVSARRAKANRAAGSSSAAKQAAQAGEIGVPIEEFVKGADDTMSQVSDTGGTNEAAAVTSDVKMEDVSEGRPAQSIEQNDGSRNEDEHEEIADNADIAATNEGPVPMEVETTDV